jgi:hypothetical protein
MSSNPELQEKKDAEVDLIDLFIRLGKLISRSVKALGRGFLFVFFFLVRNVLWLGLSLVLGVGISYLIKFSTERSYSSDITIKSNTVSNSEMISYINKLHTFCSEKNFEELASSLMGNKVIVKDIKDIQAFWVIDKGPDGVPDYIDFKNRYRLLDTINVRMQDRFIIRVKTSVPKELSAIRDGIIACIEKNQFFQEQNKLRLKQADAMLARIDYEVEQLDSLQKVKYFEESRRLIPKEGGQMIFLQENKTQLLHEDIYLLIQRRQQIEKIQTIYSGIITLLSDFTPPSKPDNGALYYGKVIIPIIFVLALIILLLIHNRKRIADAYGRYQTKGS